MGAAMQLLSHPSVAFYGVGSGQFFMAVSHFGITLQYETWRSLTDIHSAVHNWPLEIATQSGIPALLIYAYAVFRTAARGWAFRSTEGGRLIAAFGLIVAILYLTALQLDTTGTSPWVLTPVVFMLVWIQQMVDKQRWLAK